MYGQELRYVSLPLGLYSFLISVPYLTSFKLKQKHACNKIKDTITI